ncbi:hypothetical protein K8353_38040 [Burkholderia contaminans]|nr:hypothetical protein [Burkholderia contaminans]
MTERPILFSGPMVRAIREGRKTQTRRIVKVRGEQPPAWATFASEGRSLAQDGGARPVGSFFWSEEQQPGKPLVTLRRWPVLPEKHPMAGDWYWTPSAYGKIGDRLWVREAFMPAPLDVAPDRPQATRWNVAYAAGGQSEVSAPAGYNPMLYNYERWTPSIHMPRWASRITLEVTGVRVERLQSISENDAIAEGAIYTDFGIEPPHGSLSLDGGRTFHPVVRGTQRNGWHMGDATSHTRCMRSAKYAFANLINRLHGGENWNTKGPGLWEANPWVWVIEFRRIG